MAAPTLVQSPAVNRAGSAVDTYALTFASTPSTGNEVVVLITAFDVGGDLPVGGVTDNKGNTYTRQQQGKFGTGTAGTDAQYAVYTAPITSSSATFTITADPTGTSSEITMWIGEFSGVHATTPVNTSGVAEGTTAAPTISLTTTADDCYVVGLMTEENDNAMAVGSGTTEISEIEDNLSGQCASIARETTPGASGTHTLTWALTGAPADVWACVAVAIAPAAAAGGTTYPGADGCGVF